MKKSTKVVIGVAAIIGFGGLVNSFNEEEVKVQQPKQTTIEVNEKAIEANKPNENIVVKEEQQTKVEKQVEVTETKPVNVIAQLDKTNVLEVIKENAKLNWPDDYMMQEYEINEQTSNYNALVNIEVDTKEKEEILRRALNNWHSDFMMIKYEYSEQVKAFDNIN